MRPELSNYEKNCRAWQERFCAMDQERLLAAIPGLRQEFTGDIPDELRPYWKEDINFHSAGWWAELWKQSTRAAVRDAFSLRSHKAAWEDWLQCDNPYAQRDAGMIYRHHRYRVPGSLFGTVPSIIR